MFVDLQFRRKLIYDNGTMVLQNGLYNYNLAEIIWTRCLASSSFKIFRASNSLRNISSGVGVAAGLLAGNTEIFEVASNVGAGIMW